MSMSQKDYILIAAALKRSRERASELGVDAELAVDYTITQVCTDLAAAHKGYPFKRDTFLAAAGFGGES